MDHRWSPEKVLPSVVFWRRCWRGAIENHNFMESKFGCNCSSECDQFWVWEHLQEELCKHSNWQNPWKYYAIHMPWDKLHGELQLRAPNLLEVFSTAESPIPKSVSDSKLHHALLATAICLQGRFREMTTLQYLMGFVMLHGNCTQRVRP